MNRFKIIPMLSLAFGFAMMAMVLATPSKAELNGSKTDCYVTGGGHYCDTCPGGNGTCNCSGTTC